MKNRDKIVNVYEGYNLKTDRLVVFCLVMSVVSSVNYGRLLSNSNTASISLSIQGNGSGPRRDT